MKGPHFWGGVQTIKVKGSKTGHKFQSILIGFQLRLVGFRLFLVSPTVHPSFFPNCPVDFMLLQHQIQNNNLIKAKAV